MNMKYAVRGWALSLPATVWTLLLAFGCVGPLYAQQVPVRLSFKFILNASGNRPVTGDINTDAEVTAQLLRAN